MTAAPLRPLLPHPDNPAGPVRALAAGVTRDGTVIRFDYALAAAPHSLRLAPSGPGRRRDELWRHTCFEAFLRVPGTEPYLEFNFSPSTDWQAYAFSAYREGRRELVLATPPRVGIEAPDGRLELRASVDLARVSLAQALSTAPWQLAVAAVIESARGELSYFALRHPEGKPDFHHADAFVLELTG